jgi:cytochrome c-type biogenesis protein CcmH
VLVRERLTAGDTDDEVIDFIVARYGEFVLLKPRFSARNALLWGAPALILIVGGLFLVLRGRASRRQAAAPLSGAEQARLKDILGE